MEKRGGGGAGGKDTYYQSHSWRPCGTRPGKSSLYSLATERTFPSLAVSITTFTVTKSSGPTQVGLFHFPIKGLLWNQSSTVQCI